jgi:hypothetical protein
VDQRGDEDAIGGPVDVARRLAAAEELGQLSRRLLAVAAGKPAEALDPAPGGILAGNRVLQRDGAQGSNALLGGPAGLAVWLLGRPGFARDRHLLPPVGVPRHYRNYTGTHPQGAWLQ